MATNAKQQQPDQPAAKAKGHGKPLAFGPPPTTSEATARPRAHSFRRGGGRRRFQLRVG